MFIEWRLVTFNNAFSEPVNQNDDIYIVIINIVKI